MQDITLVEGSRSQIYVPQPPLVPGFLPLSGAPGTVWTGPTDQPFVAQANQVRACMQRVACAPYRAARAALFMLRCDVPS
jgi:hypothetical protein